jgi:Ala-tRNA(Pro) deacylase
MKVQEFLLEQHVPFDVWQHRSTHSAQGLARSLDVPSDNVAKSVLLKVDGEFILAVIPASHQISMPLLKSRMSAKSVELATEDELAEVFRDCERGVAPPFGRSYGIRTLVDGSLTEDEHVVFEANSHDEAIYLRYHDYANIERPMVLSFTYEEDA